MAIGALAGVSGWWLIDQSMDAGLQERTVLAASAFCFAFFFCVAALTGPINVLRTLIPAACLAVMLAGLLWNASFRHESIDDFLSMVYPGVGYGMALLILTPFLSAGLQRAGGWRDYPALFGTSWQIVVRFVAALIFTALFWGLLSLSDALLSIVGLELLDFVTRFDAVVWALTGAAFGLALAVVFELSDYISPYLILRLLRLFLPLVFAVSLIFTIMLAIRGWDGLLGGLSPAATLTAFAIAAIVLVTITVERDQQDAVRAPFMRGCVQGMALLVPILGGLALWAIWLRVVQYGLTPTRLMALTIAGVVLAYGLAFGLAVLLRAGWMSRIRDANIWLALLCAATCLVWISPLLKAETLSARSQLDRGLAGADIDQLPIAQLAHDWGTAGKDALTQLKQAKPEMVAAIDRAAERNNDQATVTQSDLATIAAAIPVYPLGDPLPPASFSELSAFVVTQWIASCENALPSGDPGCALYLAAFTDSGEAEQALLFIRSSSGNFSTRALRLRAGKLVFAGDVVTRGGFGARNITEADLQALHDGAAKMVTPDWKVLRLGEHEIFPNN